MKLPLSCSTARAQFGEHLRGLLAPAEALPFEQHVSVCPSCREALVLERRLRAGAGQRIFAPTGFAAALLAQPHPRPARPTRTWALLQDLADETVFRALVDPLLRLDLHLRDAGTPLWQRVSGPLADAQVQLEAEGLKLCQYLAFPFIHAGRQVCTALSGPTDAH